MKLLFIQKDPFVNLGVINIYVYLKKNGHTCDLLIDNVEKDIISKINKIQPDVIAFSCTTGLHTWALDLSKSIKKYLNIPILMGGSHPTFFSEVINSPYLDMICIGEGEKSSLELLNRLKYKKDITKIKDMYIKEDGKIYKNELRDLTENLDEFPYPDIQLYKRYNFIISQKNYRIITGRGCPYNCKFCFNKAIKELYNGKGRYLRRRSIKHVIGELIVAKKKLKIKRVDFQDDTFIYNFETWLKPFLKEYKKRINLPFTCTVRANLITDELAQTLKKYGCHSVKIGIESGNEFLNNKVLGRHLSKEEIITAVDYLKKAKIKVETFNIIGIPGETIKTALETLEFNMKLGVDFARCALLQPYPKTEIEMYAKKNGFLKKSYDLNDFENSYFIDTPIILKNKNEIINLHRLFNLGIKFPFLYPLIKKLIYLPKNFIFDTIFKIDYALSIFLIDKISIKDFIIFGWYSKGFFKKK
jgi:radical SAM superfamily enzyme YgiQ (UPF0313 family)